MEQGNNNKRSHSAGLPEAQIPVDKSGLAGNSGKQSYGAAQVGHKGETSGEVYGKPLPLAPASGGTRLSLGLLSGRQARYRAEERKKALLCSQCAFVSVCDVLRRVMAVASLWLSKSHARSVFGQLETRTMHNRGF